MKNPSNIIFINCSPTDDRPPTDDDILIPNKVFRDPNLSFRAIGLIGMLLTKPDGCTISDLRKMTCSGDWTIRNALKELREEGYLKSGRTNAKNMAYLRTILGMENEKEMANEKNS